MAATLVASLSEAAATIPFELDPWLHLTAAAVDEGAIDSARKDVALLTKELGLAPHHRVVDFGAGSGRHVLALTEVGIDAVGVESSEALARTANAAIFGDRIMHGDLHTDAPSGTWDVAICMSDTFGIDGEATTHRAILRNIRRALRDGGALALQVTPPETARDAIGTHRWRHSSGDLVEQIELVSEHPLVLRRTFSKGSGTFEPTQTVYDEAELRQLAESSGFTVEALLEQSDADGALIHQMVLARAVPSYNYLNDLGSFLAAWSDPDHPRNRRSIDLVRTSAGRRTNATDARPGQGDTLTPHHPDFWQAIERGVAPLVRVLIEDWRQVCYSSCEGHEYPRWGQTAPWSDAYVGMVSLTGSHRDRLLRVLKPMTERIDGEVRPRLRVRTLYGAIGQVDTVDVLFPRGTTTDFDAYRVEVATAVTQLVTTLRRSISGEPP